MGSRVQQAEQVGAQPRRGVLGKTLSGEWGSGTWSVGLTHVTSGLQVLIDMETCCDGFQRLSTHQASLPFCQSCWGAWGQ